MYGCHLVCQPPPTSRAGPGRAGCAGWRRPRSAGSGADDQGDLLACITAGEGDRRLLTRFGLA
jgi:hypothetical protein